MDPIIENEEDKTQDAVEQTRHEYDSVAAQYSKMNRHASAEHVELLLAAMPRGVAEDRRRRDAEDRAAALKVHIKELGDAGANEEDEDLVEARTALATAQQDARRRVVDLGCGAGRDFQAFAERGVDYLGIDASEGMLTVARERFPEASFEAQDLCALDLPERAFDGAFANASLQHVPTPALPNALTNIYACLRPGGVLLISAPLGQDAEGWSRARSKETRAWVAWRSRETLERYCGAAGFESVTVPTVQSYEGSSFQVFVWRRPVDPGE
jgi:SAM-dependent methyltransferase